MKTELVKRGRDPIETVDARPTVRPMVDIYENRDEYLVVADLPAVARDRLSIEIVDSRLTIQGQVSAERDDGAMEREFGLANYSRSFDLPEFVDRSRVSAELDRGVLTLHLPKTDAVKPKQIEVRAG